MNPIRLYILFFPSSDNEMFSGEFAIRRYTHVKDISLLCSREFFGMSYNGPPKSGERCVTSKKTAAKETYIYARETYTHLNKARFARNNSLERHYEV